MKPGPKLVTVESGIRPAHAVMVYLGILAIVYTVGLVAWVWFR